MLSCNKTVELPHVDQDLWKKDGDGCKNIRTLMINQINQDKHLLKKLNQIEVMKTLGKPKRNELYKRNQKFFDYPIASKDCFISDTLKFSKFLRIRFNATGISQEISILEE